MENRGRDRAGERGSGRDRGKGDRESEGERERKWEKEREVERDESREIRGGGNSCIIGRYQIEDFCQRRRR